MKPANAAPRPLWIVLAALVPLAGCDNRTGLQKLGVGNLVPVQGKVTLAGKPLRGGTVFFYPQGEVTGFVAQGNLDADGNYSLATSGEDGAPLGKYRATVEPASDDRAQDLLVDSRYSSHTHSPLIVEVKAGAPAGAYDLKLKILKGS